MTTPTTAAGRDAETLLPHFDWCAGMSGPNPCSCGVVDRILAIEAEARSMRAFPATPAASGDVDAAHCSGCDAAYPNSDCPGIRAESAGTLDVERLVRALIVDARVIGDPQNRYHRKAQRVAAEYIRLAEDADKTS